MITVPYFFSDNAIFQSSSVLTLNGKCEPDANVLLKIVDKNNTVLFSSVDVSNAYGAFSLTVKTPAPSFDEYSVVLECGAEKKSISNVLFGEVWLASGQGQKDAIWTGRSKIMAQKIHLLMIKYSGSRG